MSEDAFTRAFKHETNAAQHAFLVETYMWVKGTRDQESAEKWARQIEESVNAHELIVALGDTDQVVSAAQPSKRLEEATWEMHQRALHAEENLERLRKASSAAVEAMRALETLLASV